MHQVTHLPGILLPPPNNNIWPLCLATQAEVSRYRSQEARILRNSAFWLGIFATALFFGPVLMAILTFGAYAVGGNALSAANGEQQCQWTILLVRLGLCVNVWPLQCSLRHRPFILRPCFLKCC